MKKHSKETTLISQWVSLNPSLQEILTEKIEDLNSIDDETLNGVIVAHFTSQVDYRAIAYELIRAHGIDLERWFNSL